MWRILTSAAWTDLLNYLILCARVHLQKMVQRRWMCGELRRNGEKNGVAIPIISQASFNENQGDFNCRRNEEPHAFVVASGGVVVQRNRGANTAERRLRINNKQAVRTSM